MRMPVCLFICKSSVTLNYFHLIILAFQHFHLRGQTYEDLNCDFSFS